MVVNEGKSPVGKSFGCSFILPNPRGSALSWSSRSGPCVDSPGTLAVRLGAALLVLQVAWEAEPPSRGEGLGLLDNPKSAWSSHAKAAPSGKDTRVLNLQNKERRTRDSLFFHARARRCTYLRAIASVNARILGLWSHAICHSGFIHRSHATRCGGAASHTGESPPNGKTSYENWNLLNKVNSAHFSLTQRVLSGEECRQLRVGLCLTSSKDREKHEKRRRLI